MTTFDSLIHEILYPPSLTTRLRRRVASAIQNTARLTRLLTGRASIHDPKTQWGVRWAIWCGADVNGLNSHGDTRLHVSLDNLAITRLLADAGADLNAPGAMGLPPLLQTMLCANIFRWRNDRQVSEVITHLIKRGAALSYGSTHALHLAIDDPELVKLILAYGANINARDSKGSSALFRVRTVKMAKLLLKHGADPNIRDYEGNSAEDIHIRLSPKIAGAIAKHRSGMLLDLTKKSRAETARRRQDRSDSAPARRM